MMRIVLIEPQIPPNTGNVARLCAANGVPLHLVGQIGFDLSDKAVRRAGMDYWKLVDWEHFLDKRAYLDRLATEDAYFFSSKATVSYTEVSYSKESVLVFGSETSGFDQSLRDRFSERLVTIPMMNPHPEARCLNLSTSVGIGFYEALRQTKL